MELRTLVTAANWWIDAICINQGNVEEKNQQVALKRQIYEHAQPAVIWLGKAWDGLQLAISAIGRLAVGLPTLKPF